MKNSLNNLIRLVHDIIYSVDYLNRSRVRKEDFTRMRKLGFAETVLLLLGHTKRSLQIGLNAFFESMGDGMETYTKQAFSKGRLRIKPEAIKELVEVSTRYFYSEMEAKPASEQQKCLYRGYRVCAVDGTKYNLPTSAELREKYGEQITSGAPQIQAQGSCLYDVINSVLVDVAFCPFKTSERYIAAQHINNLKQYESESWKELLVFDRGYPSYELIEHIRSAGYYYVMRCSTEFVRKMKLSGNDCVVYDYKFSHAGSVPQTVRIVRFELPSGQQEILATNIFDVDFTVEDFKRIYKLRWNIEKKYNDIKNKLEIENFSGTSEIAVLQDFYATMFLANLAQAVAADNAEYIESLHNSEENKLQYKLNISATIAELKMHVVEMLMTDSKFKSMRILKRIARQLENCVVPVRDGRREPRTVKHRASAFPQNMRN